jgi:adenine-specific DNA-methyltransferase
LIEADDSRNATEGVPPSAAALDFITSGNIDRYQIEPGNVRYLGRTYRRPRLARGIPELTEAKRRLFGEPKIVVAGMSRRLEAAWDGRGLALGVQVFAARDFDGDPFYLLALLNSKLLSFLFRTRFAAKRLAGGYLAINKGQLAQLPMAARADLREQVCSRLSRLAQAMHRQPQGRLDREIDRLVYEQYQLTDAEIDRVEQAFLLPRSRAA